VSAAAGDAAALRRSLAQRLTAHSGNATLGRGSSNCAIIFPATAGHCAVSTSCIEKTKPPALVFPKPEPKSKPGRNAAAVKVERRTRRARLARRSRSSNTLTAIGGGSGQLAHRRLPLHFSSIHLSTRSSAPTVIMMNNQNSRFESFNVTFDFSFTL